MAPLRIQKLLQQALIALAIAAGASGANIELDYAVGGRTTDTYTAHTFPQDGGLDLGGTSYHREEDLPIVTFTVDFFNDTGSSQEVNLSQIRLDNDDSNHYYTLLSFSPDNFTVADGATQSVTVTVNGSVAVTPALYGSSTVAYVVPDDDPGSAVGNQNVNATTLTDIEVSLVGGNAFTERVTVNYYGRMWYGNNPNWATWLVDQSTTTTFTVNLAAGAPPTNPYRFRFYFAKFVDETVSGTFQAVDGVSQRTLDSFSIPAGMIGAGSDGKLFWEDYLFELTASEEVRVSSFISINAAGSAVFGDTDYRFIRPPLQNGSNKGYPYADPPHVNTEFFYVKGVDDDDPWKRDEWSGSIDPETGQRDAEMTGVFEDGNGVETAVDLTQVIEEVADGDFDPANGPGESLQTLGRADDFIAGEVEAVGDVTGGVLVPGSGGNGDAAAIGTAAGSAQGKASTFLTDLESQTPPSNLFDVGTWTGPYVWQWPANGFFNPPPLEFPIDNPWVGKFRALVLLLLQIGTLVACLRISEKALS